VHLNKIVSQVKAPGDAIDLAVAANMLEVNFLDKECAILIEPFVNVSNVWIILESLISRGLETTAQACIDVICDSLLPLVNVFYCLI
jgi:hypothetical protein